MGGGTSPLAKSVTLTPKESLTKRDIDDG